MNRLELKHVTAKNFQSLIEADIDFNHFEDCLVKVSGFNNTESTATSNGSGKSSIFESVLWAIYQSTSSGNKEVSNRLTGENVSVDLQFSLNNEIYLISRQMSAVMFGKLDSETGLFDDFSATNRSETNKKILEVVGITEDMFLNTIFISQNSQALTFSGLSPSSRKERIEELVDIEAQMSELTDRVAAKLKTATLERDCDQRTVNDLEVKKSMLMSNISSLKSQLSSLAKELEAESSKVEEDFTEREKTLKEKLKVQEEKLEKLTEESQSLLDPVNTDIRALEDETLKTETVIKSLKSQLKNLQDSSVCPVCKRPFDETDKHSFEKMKEELEIKLAENTSQKQKTGFKLQTLTEKKDQIATAFKKMSAELSELISQYQSELSVLEKKKQNSKSNLSAIQAKQQLLQEQEGEKNFDLMTASDTYREAVVTLELSNQRRDILEDLKKRLIVEFRSYILGKVLEQFNQILLDLSEQVFDDKKIQIIFKKTKIDIEIQSPKFSQSYESLSGGEKRKTDLVLILAQQKLLSQVTDSSSNVLILDEVLENMDEVAMNSSLNLIQSCQQQGMSIFVISHTEYQAVNFDYEVRVVKETTGSLVEILRS